jgi:5-methylcytosine-specific restriction endonuclease McrA
VANVDAILVAVADLPHPDSAELSALVRDASAREVYRILFERRDDPPTMQEIRQELQQVVGNAEQLDRRKRDLHPFFVIEPVRAGGEYRHKLLRRKAQSEGQKLGISAKLRARVLQFGRCEMCGRTAKDDAVKLHVDHKMPQAWGGTNHPSNLQALCAECNQGKKDHFASIAEYGPQIAAASEHASPHMRIGELLKAVSPGEARSDIVEMVAHSGGYQSDWRKRARELRELGWEYTARRERDGYRDQTYWRVTKWTPWPQGDIAAEIRRREQMKHGKPVAAP